MRRRLLNMDWFLPEDEMEKVMTDFLQKLADSGYDPGTRQEIMKLAARKYFSQPWIRRLEEGGFTDRQRRWLLEGA